MKTTEQKAKERGGLRFEVYETGDQFTKYWRWRLVGKDGSVCVSAEDFANETMARSHIAKNKGRLKASGYAKVVTIDA